MLKLEFERRKKGLTQQTLGTLANVDVSYVCRAERHGVMYPSQLSRIAQTLKWRGEPDELLKEVE